MINTKFRESIHSQNHTALRNFLIKKRKALGITQKILAEKLGEPPSLVGKIETGDRRLDFFEMQRYCEALNTDMYDLLRWQEAMNRNRYINSKQVGESQAAFVSENENTDENYTLTVSVVDALGVSETKSLDRAAPKKGVALQIKTEEHTVSVMVL